MCIFLNNLRIQQWEVTSRKKACVKNKPWQNGSALLIFTHVWLQRENISDTHFLLNALKSVENGRWLCGPVGPT